MLHLIADPAYKRGVSSALDCDADAPPDRGSGLQKGGQQRTGLLASVAADLARLAAVRAELAALTAPAPVVALDAERAIVDAARRAREVLSVGYAERPGLVRAVLGAVLVGRLRVGLRDGRLWMEGEGAPSRLVWREPGGTRGAETTPTGPARSPGSVDVRVPLRRAV